MSASQGGRAREARDGDDHCHEAASRWGFSFTAAISDATARIDLPSVVRLTIRQRPYIIAKLPTIVRIWTMSILTPPIWIPIENGM